MGGGVLYCGPQRGRWVRPSCKQQCGRYCLAPLVAAVGASSGNSLSRGCINISCPRSAPAEVLEAKNNKCPDITPIMGNKFYNQTRDTDCNSQDIGLRMMRFVAISWAWRAWR